jgi:hypothetical protein
MTTPILWKGEQAFRVVGTGLHEDTLRVRSNYGKREDVYRLRLPTLCITYADMKFINAIGGRQLNWPDSAVYGAQYFDPPVDIVGLAEVERLTWIRGAHRVVIGPQETLVEWHAFREVVIPRLRIGEKEPAEALLQVDNAVVDVEPPLLIDISQHADGRSIGGVQVVKRHPEWREPTQEQAAYRLWIRVVDFANRQPLSKAKLALFRWKGKTPSIGGGKGTFELAEEAWTDATGSVVREPRPADVLEAATLAMPGWRATAKVWRAQANEPVNLLITAVRLKSAKYPAAVPGAERKIYAATYQLDSGESLESLAAAFRYRDVAEIIALNKTDVLDPGAPIRLPGWYFLHAQAGDTLDSIAAAFKLQRGWPRTTGRHYRPDPSLVIEHEIVAVPGPDFAAERKPE